MNALRRWYRWWVGADETEARAAASRAAVKAMLDGRIRRAFEPYEGGLLCERCRQPVLFSTENDFHCDVHGFVNAIRVRDGALLAGDGVCGEPRILRMEPEFMPYLGYTVLG